LEKEDTPHSFSSKVFLHYYKFYFFLFFQKIKNKERNKYVALDFSANLLFFILFFVFSFLLREGEKNPKKQIQKKKR
jgi:hypothetical protein